MDSESPAEVEPDTEVVQDNVRRSSAPDASVHGSSIGDSRRVCPSCGRRFNPISFERHQRVCQQVFRTVRPQFDPMKGSSIFSKVTNARVIPPKQDIRSVGANVGCRTVTRAATAGSLPLSTATGPAAAPSPPMPLTAVRGVSDASRVAAHHGRHTSGQRTPPARAATPVVVVTTLSDESPSPAFSSTAAVSESSAAPVARPTGSTSAVVAAAVAAAAGRRDLSPTSSERPAGQAVATGGSAIAPPASDRPVLGPNSADPSAATSGGLDNIEEQEQRVKSMLQRQMQELHEMRRQCSRGTEAQTPQPLNTEADALGSPLFDTISSDEVINTFLSGGAAGSGREGSGDFAGGMSSVEQHNEAESCGGDTITTAEPYTREAGMSPPQTVQVCSAPQAVQLMSSPASAQAASPLRPAEASSPPQLAPATSPQLPAQARCNADGPEGASSPPFSFVGTGAAAGSRAPKHAPNDSEPSQSGAAGLKVCEDCGRRFNPASFEKHRAVCRSVFGGKSTRTPFESSSQRLRSLPVRQAETPPRRGASELSSLRESFLPGREGPPPPPRALSPPKQDISPVVGAETGAVSPGHGATPAPPAPAQVSRERGAPSRSLQMCPFCSRSFRPAAFEKHTKVCQSVFPKHDHGVDQKYVYDSRRHRLKGTPFEAYGRPDRKTSVSPSPCDRAASSTPPQPPRVTFAPSSAQNTVQGRGSSRSPKMQLRRSVSESQIPASSRSMSMPAAARSASPVMPATAAAPEELSIEPLVPTQEFSDVQIDLSDFCIETAQTVNQPASPAISVSIDVNGTAPADAAAGAAPRSSDWTLGETGKGLAKGVLHGTSPSEAEQAASGKAEANTDGSPRKREGVKALWEDRRGLLERARFGMKMSQRTEYTPMLGSSVSQDALRDPISPKALERRTPSVRALRRHLAPPPKGSGTRSPGPGGHSNEETQVTEPDSSVTLDTEPLFDSQDLPMPTLTSPATLQNVHGVQGCGDAGSGGRSSGFDRRRGSGSGGRRGRSTEDFRSYYERCLEHLGSLGAGSASVPEGAAAADSCGGSSASCSNDVEATTANLSPRSLGPEATATCSAPAAIHESNPMPRKAKLGIAREDAGAEEGKPAAVREDAVAAEGKPGLAQEQPAEGQPSLQHAISGDLGQPVQTMLTRSATAPKALTVVRPVEVLVADGNLGAPRITRQSRDETPQCRTPRASAPYNASALQTHQSPPGQQSSSAKVLPSQQFPSPRRKSSENPMIRREGSSAMRLRPGPCPTASTGNLTLGSAPVSQASVSSSVMSSTQITAPRTVPSVVASVGSPSVSPTSSMGSPSAAAALLTSSMLQGGEGQSGHGQPGGVPAPLLQSSSFSGAFVASRSGVPRLDFGKVGQPHELHRTQSGNGGARFTAAAASSASTAVGVVQPANRVLSPGQATSASSPVQPVQKQAVQALSRSESWQCR